MMSEETFRTFYADPGEEFGWCIARGTKLLAAGQGRMWNVVLDLQDAVQNPDNENNVLNGAHFIRDGVDPKENFGPIGRIVCEDWRIYPWKAKSLAWDRCRTARAIGGISLIAMTHGIPMTLQGADIKDAALAAGGEELFYEPRHDNRHQNDAILHFCFDTSPHMLKSGDETVEELS